MDLDVAVLWLPLIAAWHAICQQVPTDNTNVRELMSPLGSPSQSRRDANNTSRQNYV
jgi:hypothetical protein